jgi:hypothetical protein
MMSVADVKKLTVLVHADNGQSDDEAAFGARQLESARKAELSLEDEITYANADLAETNKPEQQTPRPRQQQIENLQ